MRTLLVTSRKRRSEASSVVLRKYRLLRHRRRYSLRHEYQKLRCLLSGSVAASHLSNKVSVVDAAYRYICRLQSALLLKFSTTGVPKSLAGVMGGKVRTAKDVRTLALHFMTPHPHHAP
ncbi:hypothetical protein Pmani_010748 [Petrolisthes manimaculis]|uniref:BHLH domain-containing protein n=1 Tax=Petrolisthes manimaculis TaxID=1843537 RepID=A0AAE1Q1H1_9EUCA|nr:hypothetical protein Pmani_010748 [Petrolisthes manimaculis]